MEDTKDLSDLMKEIEAGLMADLQAQDAAEKSAEALMTDADRERRQARWDDIKGGEDDFDSLDDEIDEDDFDSLDDEIDEDDFDSLDDENGPSDADIEEMEVQKAIDKAEKK
jgi:hypothetical protein